MARPIAPTPTLRGEDARRFVEAAKNPKPFKPPRLNTDEEIEEIKRRVLEYLASKQE